MSRLSKLVRRYYNSQILHGIVRYLETIDLPGETKKAIAMTVAKTLHTKTGGKWDKEIERAVSGAIEWILAQIREEAKDWRERNAPLPEPAEPEDGDGEYGGSIYGNIVAPPIPSDSELLDMGFKSGEPIWGYEDGSWTITPTGYPPPDGLGEAKVVRFIGGE